MMNYTPLPTIEPKRETETVDDFGYRVLMFLLTDDCFATLPDAALEQAENAAKVAVASKDILPVAVTNISKVRHKIALVLEQRRKWIVSQNPLQPRYVSPVRHDDDDGRVAPLVPVRPRKGPPTAIRTPNLMNPF